MKRALVRRLAELASRLDGQALDEMATLEAGLVRLSVAVDGVADRHGVASTAADRLAVALDRVADGVVVADESGEIVFRNRRAEAYDLARHGDALVERTLTGMLARALAGEEAKDTLDLWGPPRRTVVVKARPLRDGLRPIGAVAVVEDVTESRRLDAVRRDFVANTSHELKTPVGALAILADALVGEDDPAVVRRLADRVLAESIRLAHLIDDLLDLSRTEADDERPHEPVAIDEVIGAAVDRVRTQADHHSNPIEIDSRIDGAVVVADRSQLVGALQNLLENAVKYSDPGGGVRIEVSVDVDVLQVSVVDQGIGIPARDIERIFERFYRVDRARASDTGGTGLGLAIVRHVAQNHGGEVLVDSREGEGSTFTLRLPLAQRHPQDALRTPSTPTVSGDVIDHALDDHTGRRNVG